MNIQSLIQTGDIEECPVCLRLSAYSWSLCDEETGKENGIAHIPTTSGFEWECGHCHSHLVPKDSPILAEVYTHNILKELL